MITFFTNSLGYRIPEVAPVEHWSDFESLSRLALLTSLQTLAPINQAKSCVDLVMGVMTAKGGLTRKELLLNQHQYVARARKNLPRALSRRAKLIGDQIHPWLQGSQVLDVGCGSGLVMHQLPRRWNVLLADVACRVAPGVRFPFKRWRPNAGAALWPPPDILLLLTVLHHARDPYAVVKASCRTRPRRIVVIESVLDRPTGQSKQEQILMKCRFQERAWSAVIADWFYNRILQREQLVPYNFGQSRDWVSIFSHCGFKQIHEQMLGIDQVLVPEVHWLGIFEPST